MKGCEVQSSEGNGEALKGFLSYLDLVTDAEMNLDTFIVDLGKHKGHAWLEGVGLCNGNVDLHSSYLVRESFILFWFLKKKKQRLNLLKYNSYYLLVFKYYFDFDFHYNLNMFEIWPFRFPFLLILLWFWLWTKHISYKVFGLWPELKWNGVRIGMAIFSESFWFWSFIS